MAEPNAGNVVYGAGTLYIAPLASVEPTSVSSAWDAAWTKLGYTDAGSTFSYQLAVTAIDVAEELNTLKWIPSGLTADVAFALAEMTKRNLSVALNGGIVTADGTDTTFEPPDLGSEVRVMIGWDAANGLERWIYRQCLQSGNVQLARQKTAKAMLPVQFNLEKPNTGQRMFKVWFSGQLND
jgi:hypothetical protein